MDNVTFFRSLAFLLVIVTCYIIGVLMGVKYAYQLDRYNHVKMDMSKFECVLVEKKGNNQ